MEERKAQRFQGSYILRDVAETPVARHDKRTGRYLSLFEPLNLNPYLAPNCLRVQRPRRLVAYIERVCNSISRVAALAFLEL